MQQRNMTSKQDRLVINADTVLVISKSSWKNCLTHSAAPTVGATSPNMDGATTACAENLRICVSRSPMRIPKPLIPR